jgi:hypothetical protein
VTDGLDGFGSGPYGEGSYGSLNEEAGAAVPEHGSDGYGYTPWGGPPGGNSPWGGPTPDAPLGLIGEFDIFCVHRDSPVSLLLTAPDTSVLGGSTQYPTDPTTGEQIIQSGGVVPPLEAEVSINKAVPAEFTVECVFRFLDLPQSFVDITSRHIFLGVSDAQGACAGLFFSQVGLAFTGAVHVDSEGTLVLDSALQPLPDSHLLVSTGESWTLRMAVSAHSQTTYIFLTRTADVAVYGHRLRYILPAVLSSSALLVPPDRTQICVRGMVSQPSALALTSLCLGTGVIIPNLPPHADAGDDQAVRFCGIARLDGGRSFDPEGAPVTYLWRLIDTPPSSQFTFQVTDGATYPLEPATGFTSRLYSTSLGALHDDDPLAEGDVVVVDGEVHVITATGVDEPGFYVVVEGEVLPDTLPRSTFLLYRQRGVSGRNTQLPTFYADVPGIYRFDLVVSDGHLFSEPAVTTVNVTESAVPRGCTPDLSFLWNYLSDFWKLVEDRERIDVFWSGLAQAVASELLTLWQIEYSKSLRDIQRTFQRRWLHYDLRMVEPLPALTTVRAVYGGLRSANIAVGGISAAGTHLDLLVDGFEAPIVINLTGAGLMTPEQIAAELQAGLYQVTKLVKVHVQAHREGTLKRVRLDAPVALAIAASSTCPGFAHNAVNGMATGYGRATGPRSYLVDRSLQDLDIVEGDLLVLEDVGYRIVRVIDDPSDAWPSQRLTLLDELPFPASGTWTIAGYVTSKQLDFSSALVTTGDHVDIDIEMAGSFFPLQIPALAVCPALPGTLAVDASSVGRYLVDEETTPVFVSVVRRKYIPLDPLIVDVPLLQENIVSKDDSQVLRRNVDYFQEKYRGVPCLRFMTTGASDASMGPYRSSSGPDVWENLRPPDHLWAEYTYLDNRPAIEANFGIPAEFTLEDHALLPSSVDYLSTVRGLWYAYFNGPTLRNIRVGTQILLGLPFAEELGVIEEIRTDFSVSKGRLLIRDASNTSIVRAYTYPSVLDLETNPATGKVYAVGDTVAQFAPLVEGVEVLDYIKDPKWIRGWVVQGSRFEVEKYFLFLVRVDMAAFNLQALIFASRFVRRIKPTYCFPLFVVQTNIGDTEVSVSDVVRYHGRLTLFAGLGPGGEALMFDQFRPSYGGLWSHHDQADPNAPPTPPDPTEPIVWTHDEYEITPREVLLAKLSLTYGAPTAPVETGSIFVEDVPVFTEKVAELLEGQTRYIAPSPGKPLGLPQTSTVTATVNKLSLFFRGIADGELLTVKVQKNGVDVETVTFTPPASDVGPGSAPLFKVNSDISVDVVPGDVLSASLFHPSGYNTYVEFCSIILGVGQDWDPLTPLAAGTYATYLPL